jgi:hypothetical protein
MHRKIEGIMDSYATGRHEDVPGFIDFYRYRYIYVQIIN